MNEAGWIPLDPTAGEYGYLDATHVRLWEKGAIEKISVKVLNYTDEGEGKQVKTNRLMLTPGDKKRYSFIIQGNEVGYHEYEVISSEKQEGIFTYYLQSYLYNIIV